jgi:hypothetical protein
MKKLVMRFAWAIMFFIGFRDLIVPVPHPIFTGEFSESIFHSVICAIEFLFLLYCLSEGTK